MGLWTSAEFDNHEQICFFSDEETGLKAIVAIHSTARGPAAGGTRFKSYESEGAALADALRLSRAMRSEERTSEPQSLMRTPYAVFCLKKQKRLHTTRKRTSRTTSTHS